MDRQSDVQQLQQHVLDSTIGLGQICKDIHLHRFLSTETLRSVLAKAVEMNKLKQFGSCPATGWDTPCLPEITGNRWERLKRVPLPMALEATPNADVTGSIEKFESTFMPKHFGVELITPKFSFVEESLK